MTKAATTGVIDHTPAIAKPERPNILINKAAPTAKRSTSTENIAPLLVSVSFVNIFRTSLSGCLSCSIRGGRIEAHPPLGGCSGGVMRVSRAWKAHRVVVGQLELFGNEE